MDSNEKQKNEKNDASNKSKGKCELDQDNCLSLASILESFSVISEEHAWALCYQCSKYCKSFIASRKEDEKYFLVTQTQHLRINQDGQIHPTTFSPSHQMTSEQHKMRGSSRVVAESDGKIISNLATVIFYALDFGLAENQERYLSPQLESLIDSMASAGDQSDDDELITPSKLVAGGDDDNNDKKVKTKLTFDGIIDLCTTRLQSSASNGDSTKDQSTECNPTLSDQLSVDNHYQSVCRSMVAEALALSSFLQKISNVSNQPQLFRQQFPSSSSSSSSSTKQPLSPIPLRSTVHGLTLFGHNDNLRTSQCHNVKVNFALWAQCWFQVMGELRTRGVTLKKVTSSHNCPVRGTMDRIVYTLSPYETLMEDIRGRRYKLKNVSNNGSLPPRIKTDPYSLILEFIRSKPPLKKVEDRVLRPPPQKIVVPREILMEEIRQKPPLKPVNSPQAQSTSTVTRKNKTEIRERPSQ